MPEEEKQDNIDSATLSEFIKRPWVRITGALVSIITVWSIGYRAGNFMALNKIEIEKLKLERDCLAQIQVERNKYKELEMKLFERDIREIKSVIKKLENSKER